jgi:hypothetical protein
VNRADPRFTSLVETGGEAVVATYERLFDLKSFTGRSGTMYGYEGLGCIYWHMVSKLLLSVQEVHAQAMQSKAEPHTVARLAKAYQRVRQGLGFNKSARVFGAFPSDPYSHTPRHGGAQQPGMTGSVKEEILARLGELGVEVQHGALRFSPALLSRDELLTESTDFHWFDTMGASRKTTLKPGELGFTLCQVPVTYRAGDRRGHEVRWADGTVAKSDVSALDVKTSRAILERTGEVSAVTVSILASELLTAEG